MSSDKKNHKEISNSNSRDYDQIFWVFHMIDEFNHIYPFHSPYAMDHRQFQPTLPQTWLHWRTALAGNHEPALHGARRCDWGCQIQISSHALTTTPSPLKIFLK